MIPAAARFERRPRPTIFDEVPSLYDRETKASGSLVGAGQVSG